MLLPQSSYTSLLSPIPLTVAKLSLANFRNYVNLRLYFSTSTVVITGKNGCGKTNLLEAISLLVPGRGLRHTPLNHLQNNKSNNFWATAIDIRQGSTVMTIGTGRDFENTDNERRLVHIDGKNVKSHSILAEHVAMTWVTPDMDRILAEGATMRRKFLDRLAYSFDPAHKGRLTRYEKALRERLRLLREGFKDDSWLNALENEMALTGVAIAATRRHLIRQLRIAIGNTNSVFPKASLEIKGVAEESLENKPALLVEELLREGYVRTRDEDTQSGTCLLGPHRSDLVVFHQGKNCLADLCSTGEQKALLLAIMIAYVRILIPTRNILPLFLLDDIAAHLDDIRRDALFEEIRFLGVQAWLTGTDVDSFSSILPYAQHHRLEAQE